VSESKAALARRVRELEADLASAQRLVYDIAKEVCDLEGAAEHWPFRTKAPRWYWYGG
jgi:hypothetical protein